MRSRLRYMPGRLAAVIVLALVVVAPVLARQDSTPTNGQAFDRVWELTQEHFYDRNLHGVYWPAVKEKYRGEAVQAKNKVELQQVINRMLGELKASHLGYFTDDDLEFYLLPSVFGGGLQRGSMTHIGVTGERTPKGFIVGAVLDGSPAVEAGIKVGDRLVDAGGEPFSPVGPFKGREGSSIAVAGERPGKGPVTFTVRPVKEAPQMAFLEATRKSARTIEYRGKKLGYFHLWTMTNDAFQQALNSAVTGKLADTDGLILDLRDGFGGHPFGFADVLFRPDVRWENSDRRSSGSSHSGYSRPVVAIINGGSRSAKEYFAYQLKKSHRAELVGTPTAGAFLGAGGYPIGPEGYLELPVTGLRLDGVRLEGNPVQPDLRVEPSDTYGPADRQLEKAEAELAAKL